MKIYTQSDLAAPESMDGWKQIYFMTDTEVYNATEEDWEIRLSDYLQQHDYVQYYLSPDENTIQAVDKVSAKVLFAYELEDSWMPSADE